MGWKGFLSLKAVEIATIHPTDILAMFA